MLQLSMHGYVDESGYLEDGYGVTWTGEDVPGNFHQANSQTQ
ncbi:MAG: hypothetical protein CM15mP71_5440 [Candidatus Poseidoniales archaeon]|nr:MAG: hypothetical protein CM15mP71_5440 [Candidatus Poseidoniales archaeon]